MEEDYGNVKKAADLIKKGWVLTDVSCPKCGKPMLKEPKINTLVCIFCGEKILSEKDILVELKNKILQRLSSEENIENIYKYVKLLYFIKKLEND